MSEPLKTLKILDFSTLLPGPFASMIFADLGAEVLRVESPTRPDLVRFMPPMKDGVSAAHAYLNRSKQSLALNLKTEQGVKIVKQLVADYDIVLEQFRPGVMARLGLSYEDLSAINPKLIYCSLTGYGQTGPLKDRAGHDINFLALSGSSSYTSRQGQSPLPLGLQVADVAGGSYHAVMAILAAVIHRQHSGEGQYIDISMMDAAFSMNAFAAPEYLVGDQEPQVEAGVLNGGSHYDYYQTKDGRYMSVASLEPKFLQALLFSLGEAELLQQPVSPAEMKVRIKARFLEKDFSEWCEIFEQQDACVEPVLSLSEVVKHPQVEARQLIADVPSGQGSQRQVASPFKFSRSQARYAHIGRILGQDSEAILSGLGYGEEDIAELRASGVLAAS